MVPLAVAVCHDGGKRGGGFVRVPSEVEQAFAGYEAAVAAGNVVAGAGISLPVVSSFGIRRQRVAGDREE